MYTVVSGRGLLFGVNQRWKDLDLSLPVKDLLMLLKDAEFKLVFTRENKIVYLRLETIRKNYSTYPDTLANLLSRLTLPLVTSDNPISLKTQVAKYRDAVAAGYEMTPVTKANKITSNNQNTDVTDVRLTHKSGKLDYSDFFKHCLVSVNGFYHIGDTDGTNGIVVSDAMKSVKLSGQNQIGIYSFKEVCELRYALIQESMLKINDGRFATINFNEDLSSKQLLLVIGGYLQHVDGKTLKRVGDSAFKVDFEQIPLLQRYYESAQYLDLSKLIRNTTPVNEAQVLLNELKSPDFLRAYMMLKQTFAVVLDTDTLYVEQHPLRTTNLTDVYVTYQPTFFPLVSQWGRHPEYWVNEEDEHFALNTVNCVVNKRLFETYDYTRFSSTDAKRAPQRMTEPSSVYLLEIGKEIIR